MSDLIWIGNTLYPRWFVISVALGALLLVTFLLAWTKYMANRS